MFSVEASAVLPFAPNQVFAIASDCEALTRWCGILSRRDDSPSTDAIADLTTALRLATIETDAPQRTVVHEASADHLTIRWELTVAEHTDGSMLRVRTSIDAVADFPQRIAVCRTISRRASDDLARMAALLEDASPPPESGSA